MMDCHDVDLFTNGSIYDSVGALDRFAHGCIIDLWTTRPDWDNEASVQLRLLIVV